MSAVIQRKERATGFWDLSSMHQLDFKFLCNGKFNSNFCKLKDLLNYGNENSIRRVNFRSIWLGSVIYWLGLWFCVRSILIWLSLSWQMVTAFPDFASAHFNTAEGLCLATTLIVIDQLDSHYFPTFRRLGWCPLHGNCKANTQWEKENS